METIGDGLALDATRPPSCSYMARRGYVCGLTDCTRRWPVAELLNVSPFAIAGDIDRTEDDLARCDDPEESSKRSLGDVDPVSAEDEHDRKPRHTSGEGPRHAAGALACEVERHSEASEYVERRNA